MSCRRAGQSRPADRGAEARLCFYYECGAHRHLHSFPTRRSSDLSSSPSRSRPASPICSSSAWRPTRCRSEEHTSELQSHVKLVCRLLPENKIMDDLCTRSCPFCDVGHVRPLPLDAGEPATLAATI